MGVVSGALALGVATTALAGEFPPTALLHIGYRVAGKADLRAPARDAHPDGYLAVSADLNGDRREDEVRVLINEATGEALVVAAVMSPEKLDTYVLEQWQLKDADTLAISAAAVAGRTGVRVFNLATAESTTYALDGGGFEPVTRP